MKSVGERGLDPGMTQTARNAMTKADLVAIVADRLKITQVQASIIVESVLRSVITAPEGQRTSKR